jgi:hypothetical protein
MFVETITVSGEVWHHWTDRLRLFSEPPGAHCLHRSRGTTLTAPSVPSTYGTIRRRLPTSSCNVSSRCLRLRESQTTCRSVMVLPLLPTSARPATPDHARRRSGTQRALVERPDESACRAGRVAGHVWWPGPPPRRFGPGHRVRGSRVGFRPRERVRKPRTVTLTPRRHCV